MKLEIIVSREQICKICVHLHKMVAISVIFGIIDFAT